MLVVASGLSGASGACDRRRSPGTRLGSPRAHFLPAALPRLVHRLPVTLRVRRLRRGRAADRQKALDFGANEFVDLDNEALENVGEVDLVRHYVNLSTRNMAVDTNFYPLGSCTMKYNPKRHERLAALAAIEL